MENDDLKSESKGEQDVTWTSRQRDRRVSPERRQFTGRAISVPDMRAGQDRRSGVDRRKVKLTITGRPIDVSG